MRGWRVEQAHAALVAHLFKVDEVSKVRHERLDRSETTTPSGDLWLVRQGSLMRISCTTNPGGGIGGEVLTRAWT